MLLFLQQKGNDQGGDLGSVPLTLPLCIPWVLQRVQDGLCPTLRAPACTRLYQTGSSGETPGNLLPS